MVVFGGKESAEQVKQAVMTVRGSQDPDQLPLIGVSDLRGVPRPARILVKGQLKKAYEEAVTDQAEMLEAAGKPARREPAKDVIMLMDWKGEAADAFGISGVEQEAVGVAIDGEGRILGSGTGEHLGEEMLAAIGSP